MVISNDGAFLIFQTSHFNNCGNVFRILHKNEDERSRAFPGTAQ